MDKKKAALTAANIGASGRLRCLGGSSDPPRNHPRRWRSSRLFRAERHCPANGM